jgi:glycosyltransferase involved in cell wall biosynthesis
MTLEQLWHRVPGGTGVAGLGMAAGLAARDDVEVIGVAAKHRSAPPDAWAPPVPVSQLPLPRLALYEAWHRLRWPAVERATGPVDVVHATTIATPPRKLSPLLVTIHDLAFLHDESHFTPRGLRFFHRGMELAQKEADLVICPSRATLEDCASKGFDLSQLRLVPMGVAQNKASESDIAAARRRYDLPHRFVLWTGTIEPRKNLPRLLRAFDRLDTKDVELVLVGPKGWNEELGPLVAASSRRIRTLGFVPPADLAAIYAAAEIFCFPSLFEGFGLPVLEAMAQGTPVVTSSGTSTAEVGGDAAWLVPPRDTVAIAHALDEILNDPALSARMGEDGIARAATYSWDETARILVEVYREVA